MPTVQNNLSSRRFEIYHDGHLAGYLRYQMNGSELWLLNTQMTGLPPTRVLSDLLIRNAVESAFRHRVSMLPFCPMVRQFVGENPQYLSLVPAARRDLFHLAPQQPEVLPGAQTVLAAKS
jgi:hypothetical protein